MKYSQLINRNVDCLLASSPPIQFVCFLHKQSILQAVQTAKLQRNTWELMNFAYHKFTWQVSSHCKQYFLLANFVEEMAFCPNIKLTNSVMVGIFITLLNTSVNTTWCIWVLLCNSDGCKNCGIFFLSQINRQTKILFYWNFRKIRITTAAISDLK